MVPIKATQNEITIGDVVDVSDCIRQGYSQDNAIWQNLISINKDDNDAASFQQE